MTKFLLDSGDPEEYKAITTLANTYGSQIWGATTNPSLIAKKLAGRKVTQQEAFDLQRGIVSEILEIVSGAVSAEVYADENTIAEEMIVQGKEIAAWDQRIYVKLPTTFEGFKARTELRKEHIPVNNTLVFTQEQSFAICLHEQIMQKQFGAKNRMWPTFISPFVGRLDDIGLDGMSFVEHSIKTKQQYFDDLPALSVRQAGGRQGCWMLEASVRKPEHIQRGIVAGVEIITVPAKTFEEWFGLTREQQQTLNIKAYAKGLEPIPRWQPSDELLAIDTVDNFMDAITSDKMNITHDLTDKGLVRFAEDWKTIIV